MQQAIKQTLSVLFFNWRKQFKPHPLVSIIVLVKLGATAWLYLMNLLARQSSVDPLFLKWTLIGCGVGAVATSPGTATSLIVKSFPQ